MGLLVESIVWHGMAVDEDLKIWQANEPAIDLLKIPYQSLKVMTLRAAARARTKAEWKRDTGNTTSKEFREIDREASQISDALTDLEKGMMATSLMGGTQAKCEIAKYNENF